MSRASNGRGTVYRSSDGRRWEGCVSFGVDPVTGKRIRKHVRGRTKSEVQAKVDALIPLGPDADDGKPLSVDARLTLSQWLDIWVNERASEVRTNTVRGYRTDLLYVARSGVGALRLTSVRVYDIKRLNSWVAEQGRSPGTIAHLRRTLSAAFNAAKSAKLVYKNPIDDLPNPKPEQSLLVPYDFTEIAKLVTAARSRRNGVRWEIALLGLRQGEVLGLRWADVDFDHGHLLVRSNLIWDSWQHGCHLRTAAAPCGKSARWCPDRHGGGPRLAQPKSQAGKRLVGLPDAVAAELRAHRRAQQEEMGAAGEAWQPLDFVFTTRTGAPIDRTTDREDWLAVVEAAQVRRLRIHDLRHTAATALLILGEDTRSLLDIMGWSSMSLVHRYAHVTPEVRRRVADRMQTLFEPALSANQAAGPPSQTHRPKAHSPSNGQGGRAGNRSTATRKKRR